MWWGIAGAIGSVIIVAIVSYKAGYNDGWTHRGWAHNAIEEQKAKRR